MDCKSNPEHHWSEDLARLHCLQALFPDWTGGDAFLLHQLKDSIEASLRLNPNMPDTFENFSSLANCLREDSPGPDSASHACIRLDFTERTWDPLFARQEIIRQMKLHSGADHVFLMVSGLRKALFPGARYRTRTRESVYLEATRFIDELAKEWSTESSKVYLLHL